jgi:hypothetical protein
MRRTDFLPDIRVFSSLRNIKVTDTINGYIRTITLFVLFKFNPYIFYIKQRSYLCGELRK